MEESAVPLKDQFFKDAQEAAVLVEQLERGRDLLGYQIAIVLRGADGSVMVAHAAVCRAESKEEVAAAVREKTAEAFGDDDGGEEDEEG